jgi:hypothetical protein
MCDIPQGFKQKEEIYKIFNLDPKNPKTDLALNAARARLCHKSCGREGTAPIIVYNLHDIKTFLKNS